MVLSLRPASVLIVGFVAMFFVGCGGGHEGCRPNPSVSADMAALTLPPPDGGKLCHAEAKFVMYEFMKDRTEVFTEYAGKLEKAGWKEIPNPAGGTSDDPASTFYAKNGKQIMYRVSKCSRSSFADMAGSCTLITFDDVTK